MHYSFVVAAALISAVTASPALVGGGSTSTYAAVSEISDGQPQAPTGVASSAAASGTPVEITSYTTEEITITSCGPTVTNCPARSITVSTTTYAVVSSTGAASVIPVPTTYTVTSVTPSYTSVVTPSESTTNAAVPASSTEVASSVPAPVSSVTPASSASAPASSAAESTNNGAVPASSAAPSSPASVSVITISTCVPTVIYSTVTVAASPVPSGPAAESTNNGAIPASSVAAQSTNNGAVPASSAAAQSTNNGAIPASGTFYPSGTGASGSGVVSPQPTSSPITPFTGSASSFGASVAMAGVAAVAALYLA